MVEHPAYLLIGEEEFLKQEALNRIKSGLFDKKNKDFNCDIFSAKERGAGEIIGHAATMPFMAQVRLVVVRDIDKFSASDKERLISYLKNPVKSSCLVLETLETNLKNPFLSSVSQYTEVISCKRLYTNEIPRWVSQRAREKNKLIRTAAVDILQEHVGNDLRTLVSTIEVLSLYVGEKKEITPEDVERVVGKSAINTTFELTDAISRRETSQALSILKSLFRDGKKPTQILGMIAWQIKRIWNALELLESGASKDKVSKELRIHKFFLEKFLKQIDNFPIKRRDENLHCLLKTDVDIKTGKKKPEIALELLVLGLCNPGTPSGQRA